MFGQSGAVRVSLCESCRAKARSLDGETWERIHEFLRLST